VSGSGFLKQMVRNIVGTTVEVGRGRIPAAYVRKMIDSRDRRTSGITAPAHGLFLDRVEY
jgi:tRNA pseudouridine38-40 synthase